MILDDASTQNLFSQDEYVRQRASPLSALPASGEAGQLMGVLYLENNLAPRVFTPKRLAMLETAGLAGCDLLRSCATLCRPQPGEYGA